MIKKFCDVCGEEITKDAGSSKYIWGYIWKDGQVCRFYKELDFCESCMMDYDQNIYDFLIKKGVELYVK